MFYPQVKVVSTHRVVDNSTGVDLHAVKELRYFHYRGLGSSRMAQKICIFPGDHPHGPKKKHFFGVAEVAKLARESYLGR